MSVCFRRCSEPVPSDAMRLEALLPADSITCCKQLPLRSNTCPVQDYDACSTAWHGLGVGKPGLFLNSTIPNLSFSVSPRWNANPSCRQISWIFHASESPTHELNMPGTLSWYSSRLAHCTLSICQKLTQCPPHEATKVLLSCCRRNLRQIECIDGIKKILSLGVHCYLGFHCSGSSTGKIPKRCGQSGFLSLLLVVGQREFEEGGV